jgi:hypothetical protein
MIDDRRLFGKPTPRIFAACSFVPKEHSRCLANPTSLGIDDRTLVQFGFIAEAISVRRNRGSVSGQRSSVSAERLPGHRRLPASSVDGGNRAGHITACATVTRSRSLATAGLPYSWYPSWSASLTRRQNASSSEPVRRR